MICCHVCPKEGYLNFIGHGLLTSARKYECLSQCQRTVPRGTVLGHLDITVITR